MRVLLDENIDPDFAKLLFAHEVETVKSMGWRGLHNGELLQEVRGQFDVFITRDRGIIFQHDHSGYGLRILVIRTPDGRIESLEKQLKGVNAWLEQCKPADVYELEWIEPS